ncbi:Protein of uncharacterised function (DUF3073) [Trueperella bialowiezensis]|uniref:Protein of uncharacterized function (DUF3073) n=2 Tax=Trueperella bialowiezensis TaxID=312285 RepID=A0A448PF91_9ACTO|nr:DUF3073 domain-containing protein [Trueperella bialowiezensis]VEI13580.1 Protein of uncharacterised function (DUF3073) [Trueperella bialowiezensis]
MGRGRQRAKQRKVARNLKYFSPETDYEALERELAGKAEQKDEPDDDSYANWDEYDPDAYEIPPATDVWDEDDWSPRR